MNKTKNDLDGNFGVLVTATNLHFKHWRVNVSIITAKSYSTCIRAAVVASRDENIASSM